jgi:hypothetical protein
MTYFFKINYQIILILILIIYKINQYYNIKVYYLSNKNQKKLNLNNFYLSQTILIKKKFKLVKKLDYNVH